MRGLITYLLLLISCGGMAQSTARMASDASLAYDAGNFERADSLYRICVNRSPDNFVYKYNAGLTAYHMAEWDSALVHFELSLGLDSAMTDEVHYNIGDCQLSRWQGMVIELDLVSSLIAEMEPRPDLTIEDRLKQFLAKDSLLAVQDVLIEEKVVALEMAVESFKSCLRLNPDDEDARYNLLYTYGKLYEPEPEKPENDPQDQEDNEAEATRAEEVKAKCFEQIKKGDFEGAYDYLAGELARDESLDTLDPLLEKLGLIVDILKGR